MQKVTALLPMKGHSERVPGKNLKAFAGKPLFMAILDTMLQSPHIDQVMINTDSEQIAEVATQHSDRVRIVWRPQEIQGDMVSMNKIIEHDLSQSANDHFLQTHSTNPLLTVDTLNRAIEAYFEHLGAYDSLFGVTRWQTRFYWADGRPVNHNPEELIRTQDLPIMYEENSNFYLFSKTAFAENGGKRIGKKPYLFEVDKLEALDIDEPADFELAEILYKKRF